MKSKFKRICVFCGSNSGQLPAYSQSARELGRLLAQRGIGLVFGGGKVGLMGTVADSVLEYGGEVIGVIPKGLMHKEVAHAGLTELKIVGTMHERKALMESLSDAFIAMPGGFGTLDELCEILTWGQLGIHRKPCGILNTAGYFNSFVKFVDESVAAGFVRAPHRGLLLEASESVAILERLEAYEPVEAVKWAQFAANELTREQV